MSDPLAELRSLRGAETDPARRAQLDVRIARLAVGAPIRRLIFLRAANRDHDNPDRRCSSLGVRLARRKG